MASTSGIAHCDAQIRGGSENLHRTQSGVSACRSICPRFVMRSYEEAAVRAGLETSLATYKCPKHLWVADAVPRNASGKGDSRIAAGGVEELLV